jgi:elongation factor P hydroxylase
VTGALFASSVAARETLCAARLESVFAHCFARRYNTLLEGGSDEPFYRPASTADEHSVLYYRGDYFASALHEVAHWCIAGEERRQLPDFGYWYTPESRGANEQRAFEAVEIKPQAVEWFFSKACASPFQVSADNIDLERAGALDRAGFRCAVLDQARALQADGLSTRASVFYKALSTEFGTAVSPSDQHFTLEELS